MSNVRYPFEGSDSDFLKAQLLYVTCATSDKDWHNTPITFLSCFL